MNTDNTEKLLNDFPHLFRNFYKSPSETGMCFGFQCRNGWFKIIYNLCENINTHLTKLPKDDYNTFAVDCVKEKFGGLRFYTNWTDNIIDSLIEIAEADCLKTCEFCGEPGTLRDDRRWIRTLCDECIKNPNNNPWMGE